jgi:hypothetical protein
MTTRWTRSIEKTTAPEAPGATIDGLGMVCYPPFCEGGVANRKTENPACGNAGPMEITKRFPQDLGNLAQNARFPHSHKPSLSLSGEKNVK